jgi:hypothetical protein
MNIDDGRTYYDMCSRRSIFMKQKYSIDIENHLVANYFWRYNGDLQQKWKCMKLDYMLMTWLIEERGLEFIGDIEGIEGEQK